MSGRLKTKPAGENAGRGPRIDCRTVSTITGHECGISTLLDEYSCEYSLSLSKWCAFLHSDGWPGRHRFGKHSLTVPVRPVYPYTHPTVPNRGVSCLAGGGLGGLLVRVGGHDGLLGVRDGGGGGVGLRLRLLHGGAVGLVLAHGGLELLQELRAGLGRDGVLGEGEIFHGLARGVGSLADGLADFLGFAEAATDAAFVVARHDEGAEAEAAAAFDDFGAAVDENDFLDRVGRFFGFFFAAVVAAPGVAFGWRHGVVRIRGRLRARRRRGL